MFRWFGLERVPGWLDFGPVKLHSNFAWGVERAGAGAAPCTLRFPRGFFGLPMSIFRPLHGFTRVFQRLSGMFVPGQVIFFPVVRGGSPVRVCGEFVEFGSSLVRVVRHDLSQLCYALHPRAIPIFVLFNFGQSCRSHPLSVRRKWTLAWKGVDSCRRAGEAIPESWVV